MYRACNLEIISHAETEEKDYWPESLSYKK